MTTNRWAVLLAVPLLVAGCGANDAQTGAEASPSAVTTTPQDTDTGTDTGTTPPDGGVVVDVAPAGALGEVLVDGEGMTLYMFDPDMQGESTCYDECATTWPPLVGPASAGEGADDSKLGSVARDDGTQQVTYDGWPLYYFARDEAPGDVNGQAVNDVWWVLDADGEPVRDATPTSY